MGIFKRKTEIENELNNDELFETQTVLPICDSNNITPWAERNISARHALTKEELLKKETKKTVEVPAGESLFAKMAKNIHSDNFYIDDKNEPEIAEISGSTDEPASPGYEDIAETEIEKIPMYKSVDRENVSEIIDAQSTKDTVSSLLEKCKSFIYDDSTEKGEFLNKKEEPLYELETVDEILSSIKQKVEEENPPKVVKSVNHLTTSASDISPEDSSEDIYTKGLELQRREETKPENIKTVRRFADVNDKNAQDVTVPAREIPVKIKMFDRAVSEPIMVAVKDNLDIGATRVLPDVNKTEVSLNSKDIQMSLADSGIVEAPVKVTEAVTPTHALYEKHGAIRKDLIDEFFEDSEQPLEKPNYTDISSDSNFSSDADNQNTRAFSLLDATNEFNKIEENQVVEVTEEEPEIVKEEQSSKIENLKAISMNLSNSLKIAKIKLIPTAILSTVLLIISLFFESSITISFISSILLAVICIINFDVTKNITSVFSTEHGIDTPISLGCILVLLHTIVCGLILKTDFINLTGIVSFSLCFNIFGKMLTQSRIIKNINLIDNTEEKNTLKIIENCDSANQIARGFTDGEASIGAIKPAVNLKGFISHSFHSSNFENLLSKISFISIFVSIIVAAISYLFLKSADGVFTVFTITSCICYPPASLMILNLPLNMTANSLRKKGCAYSGFSGAEVVSRCNAITLNSTDLFPKGSVKLQKMYVLSENQVDTTFKCAAAVAKIAKSPLTDMFMEVITDDVELPNADDINHEDKMGISGWIKDKRVLIGNRLLMEGHGIKIPESNIDKKILKAGYFPVYVAFDSRPCLLLICSYSVDDEIGYNIRNICNLGITVLVSSCDPNTTEEMITDYFGLYDGSIKVISPSGLSALETETEFSEDVVSPAVFGKSINGFLKTFTICNNLRTTATVMSIVHIFTIVLSVLALGYFVFSGRFSELNSIFIFLYLLVSSGITCLSYLFKKP